MVFIFVRIAIIYGNYREILESLLNVIIVGRVFIHLGIGNRLVPKDTIVVTVDMLGLKGIEKYTLTRNLYVLRCV